MFALIRTGLAILLLTSAPAHADDTMSIDLASSGVGTLHLGARLGNQVESEFLLDTGSAFVVLSEETRKQLAAEGALTPVRRLRAVMANNATTTAQVYRVSALSVGAGCVVHDIEAVAIPGARKNILGLSALRSMAPFTVHLDPLRLEVNCASTSSPDKAVAALALAD
jgi:predicted aspartyl protease